MCTRSLITIYLNDMLTFKDKSLSLKFYPLPKSKIILILFFGASCSLIQNSLKLRSHQGETVAHLSCSDCQLATEHE